MSEPVHAHAKAFLIWLQSFPHITHPSVREDKNKLAATTESASEK